MSNPSPGTSPSRSLARQSGRELLESGDWSHDSAAEAGDRLAEALGVRVQGVRTLTSNLRADLDEDTSAIPWWGDQGGGLERLIADHLVHAAGDLSGLILEARIHLMDLIDTWARQEASWQRRLQEDRAAPPYGGPRTLEDDLDDVRDDMHLAGIFRALAQVMDCLAVVVIGVLDLPVDIHRASWTQIDQALTKVQDQADGRAPVALQLQQLHERVARLEQKQQESAVLIQSLAEQNAQVVQAVERLRLRNQRLTVAIAALGAVCVCAGLLLAWTLRQ